MTAFAPKTSLARLAAQLASGETTSRELTETALARIEAAGGNGGAAFCFVDTEGARRQADALDALRRAGTRLSPLAGIPVSVKDLFDVQGQPTRAGSRVLADAPPAVADAPAVARLRRAGAVLVGRTNMSEFAFSGLGLNPHYGTPASPWRRAERHASGGSSSGAAVSVADGMAGAGLGSDTGGSLRIPAAFCGLTGFKPSSARVSTEGAVPLSPTLDVVGAIAPSVACCAMLDSVLSGAAFSARRPLAGARFAVLRNFVMDGIDDEVARTYEAALDALSKAGALLTDLRFAPLDALPAINRYGFSPIEAYAAHRAQLETRAGAYDPRALARIRRGEAASAADYLDLLAARRTTIAAARETFAPFDAFLMPTVPIVPPVIAALEADDAHFAATNALVLRNPSIVNFLDGCALSLPCHREGDAPVGLSIAALHSEDERVLALGAAVEAVLAR